MSVFLLMAVWVVGWSGVAMVIGAFFDLPLPTTALVGALLGPIGAVVVILLGSIDKYHTTGSMVAVKKAASSHTSFDDVFK